MRVTEQPSSLPEPQTPAGAARSDNRPKETKKKLDVVLALSGELRRNEMAAFTEALKTIGKLNRGARGKVLAALNKVFG
jgi:hypothetical protein